jgi:poly(hydroxyalkanoate) depolymerase family esterase
MLTNMKATMRDAMQLMRSGDLHAATRRIAAGLTRPSPDAAHHPGPATDILEASYRVVEDTADSRADREIGPRPSDAPAEGRFTAHRFDGDARALHYKLFVPAGLGSAAPPLIVMLHGCTQSPDDFARGTRMNALAQEHGYVVAYPAQSQTSNPGKCWNWFRNDDQQRGQGEPALIAAMTRHLVARHGLDARRVYVAGLSAGGAMAAVLAGTYPDVYAAIGVHSGLPLGAAHDLPSAFAAMKQGAAPRSSAPPAPTEAVPAIVFHGDRDATVDPRNGAAVVAQSIGTSAHDIAQRATIERGSAPGGHSFTRTLYTNAAGNVVAEQWLVHGAGHAWSGGDPSGSYTDPSGPDASEQMLRFFSERARDAIN